MPRATGPLGGPKGPSGLLWSRGYLLPPAVFELRTVQPVASRHTDRAIPAPDVSLYSLFHHHKIFLVVMKLDGRDSIRDVMALSDVPLWYEREYTWQIS
jgi:hypothetical protein